ncbi:MAG TPA: hypothetical protein VIC26_02440 [Marinagarivorans sp.]
MDLSDVQRMDLGPEKPLRPYCKRCGNYASPKGVGCEKCHALSSAALFKLRKANHYRFVKRRGLGVLFIVIAIAILSFQVYYLTRVPYDGAP